MPFICMICGNPYVGYRCIYCVKEKDDDRRNDSASKDKRNGTGKTWKEEGNPGALEETR